MFVLKQTFEINFVVALIFTITQTNCNVQQTMTIFKKCKQPPQTFPTSKWYWWKWEEKTNPDNLPVIVHTWKYWFAPSHSNHLGIKQQHVVTSFSCLCCLLAWKSSKWKATERSWERKSKVWRHFTGSRHIHGGM
jgi:hypothetical protein